MNTCCFVVNSAIGPDYLRYIIIGQPEPLALNALVGIFLMKNSLDIPGEQVINHKDERQINGRGGIQR